MLSQDLISFDQILKHFVGDIAAHFRTVTAVLNNNDESVRIVFVVKESDEPGVRTILPFDFRCSGLGA